jgi:GntR family transcriptional regulator/MocR family aminotransferase
VRLPDDCDETGLVVAARQLGVQIEGAARHWAEPDAAPPALVLGYGTAGEAAIEQGVATLGAAYAGVRAPAAGGNGA